jgi:hypothetical protein
VVVLDNASIHHDPRIVALIEGAGAVALYLSPYSPDYNPIELVFGWIKAYMKRHFSSQPIGNHIDALMTAFDTVGEENARAFFRHCGLRGEDEEDEGELTELAITLLAAGAL